MADCETWEENFDAFHSWVLNFDRINSSEMGEKSQSINYVQYIQSEHNYTILSSSIQRINYMFRPLLGHHQVVLNLQSNCTIQSVYPMGDDISFTVVRIHELN